MTTPKSLVLNNIQWLANNFTVGKKNPLFCMMIHSQTTRNSIMRLCFLSKCSCFGGKSASHASAKVPNEFRLNAAMTHRTSSEAICWDNLLMVEESSFSKCPTWRIKQATWNLSSRELSCESVTMPTCQLYQSHFPELLCQFHLLNSLVWKACVLYGRCFDY